MTDKPNTPEIKYLSAIHPEDKSGKLVSPNLSEHVAAYEPHEADMWEAYNKAEPESAEEIDAGAKLASYYLLRTAEDLHDKTRTGNEALWASRFTEASQELFGAINPVDASAAASEELAIFEPADSDSYVVQIYKKIAGAKTERGQELDLESVRNALFDLFAPVVSLVENRQDGPYDSAATKEAFEAALKELENSDEDWTDWQVVSSDKTMLSVDSGSKTIDVPSKRGPVKDKKQLLGLVFHEVGVHATRGKNGNKHGDKLLTTGIHGYGDFEEGLGVLFEYLATGVVPDKIKDRYIDIALATGAVSGIHLGRDELIKLGNEREILRSQIRGTEYDADSIRSEVVAHVNRIFRGGTGEMHGDKGKKVQAVFTKDLIYFEGFVSARRYIGEQMTKGVKPKDLLTFLLQGKFDPTRPDHIKYITKFFPLPKAEN